MRIALGAGHSKKIARRDAASIMQMCSITPKSKRWTQEEEIVLRVVDSKAQAGTFYTSYSKTCESLQKNKVYVRKHDQTRVKAKLQHLQLRQEQL
jgi:hypothetical protein